VLEPEALAAFIDRAQQDPMPALYAAHLARFEAGDAGAKLLDAAMDALTACGCGEMPDVAALRCAQSAASSRLVPIDFPPMLWPGWSLAASGRGAGGPGIIAPRSTAAAVATHAFARGDWLAWDTAPCPAPGPSPSESAWSIRLDDATSVLTTGASTMTGSDGTSGASAILRTASALATYALDRALRAFRRWRSTRSFTTEGPDISSLAGALMTVPWEHIGRQIAPGNLTAVQRSLLPSLVAFRRAVHDPVFPLADPKGELESVLRQIGTTPNALAEAVVGLLEQAAALRAAAPTSA
jgi:hypothetical protein